MPFLALIPLKDKIYAAAILALLVAFGWYTVHERHLGATHEAAALKASSDKLIAQTAKQTAELQTKATMAEQAHAKEILALSNLPPVSVRVCNSANSGSVVPKAGTAKPGNESAGAAAGNIQQVPAGDSGGRDIGPMLSVLAMKADGVSATLREFQSR